MWDSDQDPGGQVTLTVRFYLDLKNQSLDPKVRGQLSRLPLGRIWLVSQSDVGNRYKNSYCGKSSMS